MTPANWFVGLIVPPGRWFEQLQKVPSGARYYHPDDLHVMVSFLGAVEEEDARRAWDLARRLTGGPFEFPLGPIEALGSPRTATSWGVVADGPTPDLTEFLAIYRNDIAQAARARHDLRPPNPVIALAGARRRATPSDRTAIARWAETCEVPETSVMLSEVGLYTWSQEDDHRRFQIVERFTLPPYDPTAWPKRYSLRHLK